MESRINRPRAIIVGGGPVGLTAALGLSKADIDFVLLERRNDVVIEEGSDMTLLPMTMRALDQLNMLETISSLWNPVSQIERLDYTGRDIGEQRLFQYIRESTGYYPGVVSRHDLLQTLYHVLPKDAQDKIHTNKKVAEVRETSDGVTVRCTDGTAYDGTFVIGADGTYSIVRECMRKLALEAGSTNVNKAEPFLTTYQALWIRFPTSALPGCKPGSATETHGPGIATQLFAGKETATCGIYRTLPKPTRNPLRYTEADQEDLLKEWGDLPLLKGGKVCLRDAYKARLASGLVSLEEGVLSHWSWNGRVVLVGDAAHKFTPSTGSGVNHGMIDVVALVNELHNLSKRCSGEIQSTWWQHSSLSHAFQTYQQKRLDEVMDGYQQASGATALATWTNLGLKVLDQYFLSNSLVQWWFGKRNASKARATKPLAFELD